jgi:hypothetical protein
MTSKSSTTKAAPKRAASPKAAKDALHAKAALAAAPKDDHSITPEQRQADRRADATVVKDAMEFAVQQLSTPVAHTPPAAMDAFKAELAALQAKHGIAPAAVKVKAPKADKVQSNGVTRPGAATLCGKIWAAADRISQDIHGVCPVALLKKAPEVVGVNDHTIKTQYARWRQYNGVTGRLPTIATVHQVVGEYNDLPTV